MESLLVGPDGKPVKSDKEELCPKCNATPNERVPSGGFGQPHAVCKKCGYEFKEILWPTVIS